MKIIKLNADNIKRLKAVEITPEGPVVKISGRNEQGKSTVLDAIWWALGGTKSIQEEPIRRGESKGSIRLELDDLVVTRTFTPENSYLRVESREGAVYKSPQSMLDKLVGQLSFDPLAFAQADAKTQRDLLLQVTGLEVDHPRLDAIAQLEVGFVRPHSPIETINLYYKEVFNARTMVNRSYDEAIAAVAKIPVVEAAEHVSASALIQDIQAAQQAQRDAEESIRAHDIQQSRLERLREELADLLERVQATEHAIGHAEINLASWSAPSFPDIDSLQAQLVHVEETNRQAEAYAQRQALLKDALKLKTESDVYTGRLEALKAYQQELVSSAAFPIEGLGFGDEGVTYQGLPFSQASSAQKLQVSLAMAMALNPTLRVIRVDNANLLDRDHMALIEAMARDHDYQVWLEVVDDTGTVGVYIEDGAVQTKEGKH